MRRVSTASPPRGGGGGIAQTGHHRHIAHEIRLSDVLPWLTEILSGAFRESAAPAGGGGGASRPNASARRWVEWLRRLTAEHPGALLSDAYQEAHRLFRKLAGLQSRPRGDLHLHRSLPLQPRNGGAPALRPRSTLFLKPGRAGSRVPRHDAAVEGSNTYTLDRFGGGAIPFDLVVPAGRGPCASWTMPWWWRPRSRSGCRRQSGVESARELGEAVEDRFGQSTTLIGKGHVFVCMVTAEAILVFHESGSAYVHRTARLMQTLADRGFSVPLYPILRVCHHTWDSLAGCDARFRLPEHLAAAFGAPVVTATEFAVRWQEVVAAEKHLLHEIAALASPRELVSLLGARDDGVWLQRLEEYTRAQDLLLESAIARAVRRAKPADL